MRDRLDTVKCISCSVHVKPSNATYHADGNFNICKHCSPVESTPGPSSSSAAAPAPKQTPVSFQIQTAFGEELAEAKSLDLPALTRDAISRTAFSLCSVLFRSSDVKKAKDDILSYWIQIELPGGKRKWMSLDSDAVVREKVKDGSTLMVKLKKEIGIESSKMEEDLPPAYTPMEK